MYFEEEGMYRPFGEILKKEVDVPIILAGRMENPDIAVEALGKSCDIVESVSYTHLDVYKRQIPLPFPRQIMGISA